MESLTSILIVPESPIPEIFASNPAPSRIFKVPALISIPPLFPCASARTPLDILLPRKVMESLTSILIVPESPIPKTFASNAAPSRIFKVPALISIPPLLPLPSTTL